jgi:hypothetical protein
MLRYPVTAVGPEYPIRSPLIQGPVGPINAPTPSPRPIGVVGDGTLTPSGGTSGGTDGGGTQTSVSDSASGGVAMSGLDDLFSSLGNAFNNLTHPGTTSTTGGAAPTTSSNSMITWAILALVVYFLFFR